MSKYKILLVFIMLFTFGCTPVPNDSVDNSVNKYENDKIKNMDDSKNDYIEESSKLNLEESDEIVHSNHENIKTEDNKQENNKQNESTNTTISNTSSSIGKNESSEIKNENKKEDISSNEEVKQENKNEEVKNGDKQEALPEIETQLETKPEEKPICTNHNWDDSHGNKPQFNELIFDDWVVCDRVMNDIYNNFVTEEKPEYSKYYQNSKGQWMSSILACDVWCECGAHAYAIFITYE